MTTRVGRVERPKTDSAAVSAVPVVVLPRVAAPVVTATEGGETGSKPIPKEVVKLHKVTGPDGLSNDKFWGDQGWFNLRNAWRRLLSEKKSLAKAAKALVELYPTLFGYQERPEGYGDEHMGALRQDDGALIVLCTLTKTHEKEGTSQEVAARCMAWVDKEGNLVYHNAEGMEFSEPREGRLLKRTGVYTTSISVRRDEKGKPVAINEELTGIRIVCARHHALVRARLGGLPFLPVQDAAVRLQRILDNEKEYLEKGKAANDDLVVSFGEEALSRGRRRHTDQMELAVRNGKGGRRSWRDKKDREDERQARGDRR